MNGTLEFVLAALAMAPKLVAAGEDIILFLEQVYAVASKPGDPTEADWKIILDREATLRATLQDPLDTAS